MRILNIMQCTNLGGMEQASLRLMRALSERGDDVRVISLNTVGALDSLLAASEIPVEGLGYAGRWGWRSFGALKRKLKCAGADGVLMTGHNLMAMLALGRACEGRRVLAMHFHHAGVRPAWQWRLIYRFACKKFAALTFASDFILREAIGLWPAVSRIAHLVRNPLALPQLPCEASKLRARRELGLPDSVPVIGNAGWFIPRKRWDVFFAVARRVHEIRPDAHFAIAGDGPQRSELRELAKRFALDRAVTWLGWLKVLEPFYHALDILLFNSDFDALPTTPQEAMAHAVPVVASAVNSGLSEIMASGKNGYLYASHDIQSLVNTVVLLLQDRQQALSIGHSGRETVARLCNPDAIAATYGRLLSGRCN